MDANAKERRRNADDRNVEEERVHDDRHAVVAGEGPQFEAVHRAAGAGRAITQAYARDGFVKIKNVFDAASLAYYREHISSEVLRRNTNTEPLAHRDTYHRAFLQVTNLWRTNDVAREFVFNKRLADLAAQRARR